jgi:hypothetical protein
MKVVVLWIAVCVTGCQRHEPTASQPPPLPVARAATGAIGIAACDDYLHRVAACAKLSPGARAALAGGAGAWQAAAAHPGPSRTAAETGCKTTADAAAEQLTALGC